MSAISTWSTTATANNSASPNGWPELMAPSGVNNSGREMYAQIRAFYNTLEWREWSDNDIAFVSTTSFSTNSLDNDMTAVFTAGRRVKAEAITPGTIYGTVVSSSHGGSVTTVVVAWDSGVLASEAIDIFVGFDPAGSPLPSTPAGTVASFLGAAAPTGWLLLNGETIGSSAATADNKSDLYESLWRLIYTNFLDAQAAVTGGRVDIETDWTANKAIALPDAMGRVIAGVETSETRLTTAISGVDGSVMGGSGGDEDSMLHGHDYRISDDVGGTSYGGGFVTDTNSVKTVGPHTGTASSTDGDQIGGAGGGASENVQPTILFSWIVKW